MTITKEMPIMDCVTQYPETVNVFQSFGLGCIGCAAADFESIEEGATAHGMDINALVNALNSVVA